MKKTKKKQAKKLRKGLRKIARKLRAAVIKTDSGITAIIGGKQFAITSDHPQFDAVVGAIKRKVSPQRLAALFATANSVITYGKGLLTISAGRNAIYFKGRQVHGTLVQRIIQFMREDLPVDPLLKFAERLYQNPSMKAQDTLFDFLERNNLPITEDGTVLGYKGVNSDYTDHHSGKIDNSIGAVPPRFDRSEVDDNDETQCSKGYHIGSFKYATDLAAIVVIVEFAPEDVVVVPKDTRSWKIRVLGYKVVADSEGVINKSLVGEGALY